MQPTHLDNLFLSQCIELSSRSLFEVGFTPFGAIVVRDGLEIARGTSAVMELHDATAHAEVLALRNAGAVLQNHLMEGATMYCSGEPCPMCLVACYWAGIERIVCAATVEDSETAGFEDKLYYSELRKDPKGRRIQIVFGGEDAHAAAREVLVGWKNRHEANDALDPR